MRDALLLQIIFEFVDAIILFIPRRRQVSDGITVAKEGFRDKYRAPWVTIILAMVISICLIAVGFWQTAQMPSGFVAGRLGIVSDKGPCAIDMSPGGLRGIIIAWSDGFFCGLGNFYEWNVGGC